MHEFKRAVELDPQDLDAKFGLAIALSATGDLPQRARSSTRLASATRNTRGSRWSAVSCSRPQGDYQKAVANYKAALAKDETDTAMTLRLGAAQVEAGHLDEAEETLQRVLRETPNSAEAEYFIGRIAFARGRGPDALTHFDRALSLDATQPMFHLYAARAALEMANLARTLDEVDADHLARRFDWAMRIGCAAMCACARVR